MKYSTRALADLDRLSDFLLEHDPLLADRAIDRICEAVFILKDHPMIGRLVEGGLRELLISRGRTGYIALYRFDEVEDVVQVLSVRHQREAKYQ
ncbi:MAG TPA: type II toxin-antitoxin system RelE/ParE family toxin [Myxococcaceae bacterium]|nr:type II toxin-antitoxin system RelE/ParE family toxin [Myxococcaceae bacterium]